MSCKPMSVIHTVCMTQKKSIHQSVLSSHFTARLCICHPHQQDILEDHGKQYFAKYSIWVVCLKWTEEVASIIIIDFWRRVLPGPLAWFLYLGFTKSDHHYSQRLHLIVLPFTLNRIGQSDGKSIYSVHVSNISTQKREKPNRCTHVPLPFFLYICTPLYHFNINYSHV